jgi:DNA uptake protein ComE-like DNA-binding protein
MRVLQLSVALAICVSSFSLTGCNTCFNKPSNPDEVREKTAAATSEVKDDAKAVAEGLRDGLQRPTPERLLNLNSASKAQVKTLPGTTDEDADRIIAGRPYSTEHELLDKGILSREHYRKIADSVTVKK